MKIKTQLLQETAIKAVIYCRVSSARQVEEGHGLESQATRCAEYAERKGYEVIRTFHEKGVSGGQLDRPSFNALIEFLREHNDEGIVVIIDDISRFARDIESHWTLRRALKDLGGKLESPSITFGEDSDSILIENLLASVSQHQRQKNREQTKNRMRARAMGGYWCFHAPPGYRYERAEGQGKMMVRDEPLASIIAEALDGFASGRFQSQGEVKRFLESEPAFAARFPNGEVRYEEVIRLLTRPHYAGYIEVPAWGVSLRKARHEGLITLDAFTRIQERIKEGARVAARADINEDFPLRGFVVCADCERPLTACWSTSKTGAKHPYYMCFLKGCPSYRKSIRKERIEGEFAGLIERVAPAAGTFAVAKRMFADIWDARLARSKERAADWKRGVADFEKKIDAMVERLIEAESKSVVAALEKKITELERQKLVLAERAASEGAPRIPFAKMFELACAFLANPCYIWRTGRFELQRLVLKLTFAERIPYCRETGFRTPNLSLPFKALGGDFAIAGGMAERQGFEPWVGSPPQRFSRPPRSTTPAPLREATLCRRGGL